MIKTRNKNNKKMKSLPKMPGTTNQILTLEEVYAMVEKKLNTNQKLGRKETKKKKKERKYT